MALGELLRPSLLFWYGQFLMLLQRHPRHQQAWTCVAFLLAERIRVEFGVQPK